MRKVFWCAAASLVACAAAVYYAADQAAKHPDSYWGRCFNSAASLGMRTNPFVAMNPLLTDQVVKDLAQHVTAAVGGGLVAQIPGGEEQVECAEARKPVGDLLPEPEQVAPHEPEQAEHLDPFEPIKVEEMPAERLEIEDGGQIINGDLAFPVDILPEQTEEPKTGGIEESEPVAESEMPQEPQPMPYAAEECGEPKACGKEGSLVDSWFWKLLKFGGIVRTLPAESELVPMPAPCEDEESQEQATESKEQSEQGTENESKEQTPDCQQNPGYHHHYHGCPYMGGCPYPYSRPVPAVTPIEEPRKPTSAGSPSKIRHRKKKPISESSSVKKVYWFSLEDVTGQSGVDTMEFRPSDDPRETPGNNMPF